ncbi:MAG: DUF4342 domain-containing protein [Clostridia bacterium]|jgi:hypothetical protein|nr:DUF4342 domain-containing protein [Clostridia bacterium]
MENLEKIDLLRKRANVGYKEAKEALEKNGGDIVEALAGLETDNKIRPEKEEQTSSFWSKAKRLYHKGNAIRLVITKDGSTLLNCGLPLVLLLTIFVMPLVIALLILAVLTNCKIRFTKITGEEYNINRSIDKLADKVSGAADKVAEEFKKA